MDSDHFERLQAFLKRLPNIVTVTDLAAATSVVSSPFGLPIVMAGALSVHGDKVEGRFYFGNWLPEWKATYLESFFASDPLVHEARLRITPFTWTELWAQGDLPRSVCDLIETDQQHGWTDGFAVPIHGPGGYVALVSFAGGPIDLGAGDRAILLALAHAAHQRGRLLYGQETTNELKLTPRELQVLHWISRGKTDAEIAAILQISATTVHSYVEQAKRKLGVHSRSQAISELSLHELLLRADT